MPTSANVAIPDPNATESVARAVEAFSNPIPTWVVERPRNPVQERQGPFRPQTWTETRAVSPTARSMGTIASLAAPPERNRSRHGSTSMGERIPRTVESDPRAALNQTESGAKVPRTQTEVLPPERVTESVFTPPDVADRTSEGSEGESAIFPEQLLQRLSAAQTAMRTMALSFGSRRMGLEEETTAPVESRKTMARDSTTIESQMSTVSVVPDPMARVQVPEETATAQKRRGWPFVPVWNVSEGLARRVRRESAYRASPTGAWMWKATEAESGPALS